MKVVVENMVASCSLEGDLDMEELGRTLVGARFQPDIFNGITVIKEKPHYKSFILEDGTIMFHGLTSEEALKNALKDLLSDPAMKDLHLKENLMIQEIVASVDLGKQIDAKMIYEEFREEGIVYDPSELPGFILQVGTTGIEVLIFPEGKIVSRGASDLMDAVSSLQMVHGRIAGR
jgi:TATA-box binding protein (TBP) (component of TFIID and TFIIIB)